jgi:tetratricopeptide (TPR) repeat protein
VTARRVSWHGVALAAVLGCLGVQPVDAASAAADAAADAGFEQTLDQMKVLLERSEFEQAYALAKSQEVEGEGDAAFDFFFGLAALESGRFNEASFALERAAIAAPDEPRIRFDLARALTLSGNFDAARRELARLESETVPDGLRAAAVAWRARLEEVAAAAGRQVAMFVETTAGHDTNINSATTQGGIDTPLGSFTLDESAQASEDEYANLAAGIVYAMPFSKTTGIDVSAGLTWKDNFDSSTFDLGTLRLESAYTFAAGATSVRVGGRTQLVLLDRERFQHAGGIVASASRPLGGGWNGALTAAATAVRYNGDHVRDTNQYLLALSVGRQVGAVYHALSAYGADEPARDDTAGEHNGRTFRGAGYGLQWQVQPDVVALVALGWQATEYDAPQPLFAVVRDDEQVTARLGLAWALARGMTLRGEYRYTDVDGNIPVYRYDRHEVEATLRIAF